MKWSTAIFTGESVRGIIAGTKTQTRRLVRIDDTPVIIGDGPNACLRKQRGIPSDAKNVRMCANYVKCDAPPGSNTVSSRVLSPYGSIGDGIWVKETWLPLDSDHRYDRTQPREALVPFGPNGISRNGVAYAADMTPDHGGDSERARKDYGYVWRSPRFMPRWASRLTLEVLSVRVERLQDITEEDARAEGVTPFTKDTEGDCWSDGTYRTALEYAWGKLHGFSGEKRARAPWASNPWVWRIEFRRIDTP